MEVINMNKNKEFFNNTIVIGILILFVGTSLIPSICGDYNNEKDTSFLTFYTFDKFGTKECKVEISTIAANIVSDTFEEFRYKITNDPMSSETKTLKNSFVELLDRYDLIPHGLSKDYIVSLLNPRWLQEIGNNNLFRKHNIPCSAASIVSNDVISTQLSHFGSAVFCSLAGTGRGLIFTPIIFPRPRLLALWSSFSSAFSTAANLYTGHGFAASGSQTGIALGFWGIGLSFAIPGEPATFGFGGYALLALVRADDIETYPLNQKPVISDENPSNDKRDVPVSLSELSFRISDPDGDRMSYWVTTDPDIGSGEGHLKDDGVYSVDVSGLEYDKSYSWTVRVSDGKDSVEKQFGFITEMGPPFDPFDEGWQYRKKITIDHNIVAGNLENFPILISMIDPDLHDEVQFDGDDILFMDNDGVANRLFHEIEEYDGSDGELVCWVNIPNLSSSIDSVFYLYYGNLGCSSQQRPFRVWNSDFIHVWHLGENLEDSAGFDDGNDHGTDVVSGKIGKARDFEENEKDFIDFGDMDQPGDGSLTTMTFEAWVKPKSFNDECCIMNKYNTQGSDLTSYYIAINVEGKFRSSVYQSPGSKTRSITTDAYAEIGHWIYVTSTFDLGGTNDIVPFIDGNEVSDIQPDSNSDYMRDISVSDDIGRFKAEAGTRYIDAEI